MTTEEMDEVTKASASRWKKLWDKYIAQIEAAERRFHKAIARSERRRLAKEQRKKEKRK